MANSADPDQLASSGFSRTRVNNQHAGEKTQQESIRYMFIFRMEQIGFGISCKSVSKRDNLTF